MSVVVRGVKNAFRNGIRTTSIVLILAISIGLALSMLLANQAVKARINELKSKVGTTLAVQPAGSANMQGGGEPLKNDDVKKVRAVPHVAEVNSVLHLPLQAPGNKNDGHMLETFGGPKVGETNLVSSIDPGTLGQRFHANSKGSVSSDESPKFALPVRAAGISGNKNEFGKDFTLTEGRALTESDTHAALVGKDLAIKNNLKPDSTFTAYGEKFTVVGIFDTGTKFENDMVYLPLATAQRMSQAGSEITSMSVRVDSLENLESTQAAIKQTLGADKADVTTSEENSMEAVNSLKSVEQISVVGFVVSLGAAAVVIFLSMLMIVRERRREIGVLKAIGGSNRSIVSQFIVESMILVLMGAVVGMGVAVGAGNSIANALVSSNSSTSEPTVAKPGAGGAGPGIQTIRLGGPAESAESVKNLVGNITTSIGLATLSYGLLAALGIALVGSAVPAWLIAKVRPAEVLRGE